MIDDIIEFLQRVFKKEAFTRLYSRARFFTMLLGAAVAAVYFFTDENIFAAIGFAITTYILFRYGEIKGYIPR